MGKFFLAGLFLGAAVMWAVMHFFVGGGLKGERLREELDKAKAEGRIEARGEADKEWKKKLAGRIKELDDKHQKETAGLREQGKVLKAQNRELSIRVESAEEDVKLANAAKDKARAELAALRDGLTSRSTAPKELLVKVTRLRDLRLRVEREFAEACTAICQARIGWPDVKLARSVAEGVTDLASRHKRLAQDVQVYIDQHSKELSDQLGKDLAPYRAGVQERDIDAVDMLAAKISEAVKTMKADSLIVEATKDEWSDTEIFVEPGDVIQVRAEGNWRMALNLTTAGPEGWDEVSQYKLFRNARAGALILQIGISERVHPAYLGKPIVADAKGRVKLRMNDKDVRDNGGSVKAEVVSSNPKALAQVVRLWETFKKL